MMQHTRPLLPPFCERMGGYEPWTLDSLLETKQFSGSLRVLPVTIRAGQPFHLDVELHNTGLFPWVAGTDTRIELKGEGKKPGLPKSWNFVGEPMVFGDKRTIRLNGSAPEEPGEVEITFEFVAPFKVRWVFARQRVMPAWE